MELAADEEGVIAQLDHLDETLVRRCAAQDEARRHKPVAVVVRELITVPVPLADLGRAVRIARKRGRR